MGARPENPGRNGAPGVSGFCDGDSNGAAGRSVESDGDQGEQPGEQQVAGDEDDDRHGLDSRLRGNRAGVEGGEGRREESV